MKKAIYADTINGCQDIDISDAYEYPVFISNDQDDVIKDLLALQEPTTYIVSMDVYKAIVDTFGINR